MSKGLKIYMASCEQVISKPAWAVSLEYDHLWCCGDSFSQWISLYIDINGTIIELRYTCDELMSPGCYQSDEEKLSPEESEFMYACLDLPDNMRPRRLEPHEYQFAFQ